MCETPVQVLLGSLSILLRAPPLPWSHAVLLHTSYTPPTRSKVGSIQPVEAIAAVAREGGALLHSDAAQSIGKVSWAVIAAGARFRFQIRSTEASGQAICDAAVGPG